jgi:hypothetical protein
LTIRPLTRSDDPRIDKERLAALAALNLARSNYSNELLARLYRSSCLPDRRAPH